MPEPKIYDNLDDFEKEWQEELEKANKEVEAEDDEEEDEVEETEETEVEETDETEENADGDEVEPKGDEIIEPVKKAKKELKPEEKAAYSFQKMREETKAEKEARLKAEEKLKKFEETAKSLGYESVEAFEQAIEEQRIKKEAEKQGRDPEIVKELSELRRRLEKQEKEKAELERKVREENTIKAMGEFITENQLSEEDFSKVLELAANDGFNSVDDFMAVKGVKNYLKGVAADIIFERKKQIELEKAKKKDKLDGGKHKQTAQIPDNKTLQQKAEEEVYAEYGIRRK